MDKATLNYYAQNAQTIYELYESASDGLSAYFQASFPAGASIVDVGAGTACDLRQLLSLGYDAMGIEPCDALRSFTIEKHPQLEGRLISGGLPALNLPEQVDGIVCSAVLMHLAENCLFDSLLSLRDALKTHARLLISIPENRPGLDEQFRDEGGRLFQPLEADRLVLLAERLGLSLISRWQNEDSLNRPGYNWVTLLFEKTSAIGRPLDRIQWVLNRDRKVATYKLALLRGFCDISAADDRTFDWSVSGKVGVPINLMVERWLFYYWPILASPVFIAQIQSEPEGRPLKFRNSLMALISCYQAQGGLDAFAIDYRRARLSPDAKLYLRKACSDIRSAIVSGPVKYSEQGEMFFYDKTTKCIYCEADLWKEFSLTGYWIRDALVLRWAELTSKLSLRINTGDVLTLLLTVPVIERDVTRARQCYLKQTSLHCVWSGKAITHKQLAVDHVLPFSLWGNNDLWNLLPSHAAVNRSKSDKIPVAGLLIKQRDLIVDSWQFLQQQEPAMFDFELERTLGANTSGNWQAPLFDYLKRSCEYSVHLRGADIWEGA